MYASSDGVNSAVLLFQALHVHVVRSHQSALHLQNAVEWRNRACNPVDVRLLSCLLFGRLMHHRLDKTVDRAVYTTRSFASPYNRQRASNHWSEWSLCSGRVIPAVNRWKQWTRRGYTGI